MQMPEASSSDTNGIERSQNTVTKRSSPQVYPLTPLAELVGVTVVNRSVLKNNLTGSIHFSMLASICAALDCDAGGVLVMG